jgi:hypothetical protein
MKKWGILTSLLLVLLAVQTPQFGQDTSTDPGKAHWHQFAINLLRTVNTAEATYHIENGSYATWQTLLSSEPKYFDDFLARNRLIKFVYRGENVPRDVGLKITLHDPPQILPGWNLRLNVHSDGQGYDLLLTDRTDEKCGYAVLTDEHGVIRQSKAIGCEI